MIQTMCVRAHARSGDVSGYYEIGKPQVLDIRVAKSRLDRLIEVLSGEH